MDFDPAQITFAEIVDLFWKSHNPIGTVRSRQYMTAFWYHDSSQHETINSARQAIEKRLEADVTTPVIPLDVFYLAEDYHQKYRLQNSSMMDRFNEFYPEFADFNNSTAAARLNGFIAGHGRKQLYSDERELYGIPMDELDRAVHLRELSGQVTGCSSGSCPAK